MSVLCNIVNARNQYERQRLSRALETTAAPTTPTTATTKETDEKIYMRECVCAYRDIYWNGVMGMSNSWFVAAAADAVVPRYIAYFVCLFVCLSLWLFICLFCGR